MYVCVYVCVCLCAFVCVCVRLRAFVCAFVCAFMEVVDHSPCQALREKGWRAWRCHHPACTSVGELLAPTHWQIPTRCEVREMNANDVACSCAKG